MADGVPRSEDRLQHPITVDIIEICAVTLQKMPIQVRPIEVLANIGSGDKPVGIIGVADTTMVRQERMTWVRSSKCACASIAIQKILGVAIDALVETSRRSRCPGNRDARRRVGAGQFL